jgi:RND superfamily putative drug exporter
VEVQVTGIPQLYHEFNQKIEQDLVMAETISLPIALLILLGGVRHAGGRRAAAADRRARHADRLRRHRPAGIVMEMSIFVNNLATMIGLALAIDYSLFMVSRFREELRITRWRSPSSG